MLVPFLVKYFSNFRVFDLNVVYIDENATWNSFFVLDVRQHASSVNARVNSQLVSQMRRLWKSFLPTLVATRSHEITYWR